MQSANDFEFFQALAKKIVKKLELDVNEEELARTISEVTLSDEFLNSSLIEKKNVVESSEIRFDNVSDDEFFSYIDFKIADTDITNLIEPDKIVIPQKTIRILYNYPLSRDFIVEHQAPSEKGFTRAELAKTIVEQYRKIYKEEQEAVGAIRPASYTTHSPWGIWGHDIEDLVLYCVDKDDKNDCFTLGME